MSKRYPGAQEACDRSTQGCRMCQKESLFSIGEKSPLLKPSSYRYYLRPCVHQLAAPPHRSIVAFPHDDMSPRIRPRSEEITCKSRTVIVLTHDHSRHHQRRAYVSPGRTERIGHRPCLQGSPPLTRTSHQYIECIDSMRQADTSGVRPVNVCQRDGSTPKSGIRARRIDASPLASLCDQRSWTNCISKRFPLPIDFFRDCGVDSVTTLWVPQ